MRLPIQFISWLGLALLAPIELAGQTVRVSAWDLTGAAGTEAADSFAEPARQLKALGPDIILLRGVSNWKECSQFVETLKPAEYRVVTCSAFRDTNNIPRPRGQVAILARHTAYFSWSEAWNPAAGATASGGFAFAAVQVAGHRFGFSCLDVVGQENAGEPAVRQWFKALDNYRGWANNRLEGFVAAISGVRIDSAPGRELFQSMGFVGISPGQSGLTERAHLQPDAENPAGLVLAQWPMTCEFDFRPPVVVVPGPVVVAPAQAPVVAAASPPARSSKAAWWFAGAVSFALLLILALQLGIRRRLARLQAHAGLLPVAAGSYNVVLAPPALPAGPVPGSPPATTEGEREVLRQGLLTYFTEWVKQAFVQRLLRDREKMAATQQAATMKILNVDDRLARLEAKIQKETASYEKQIEQLSRELLTAREENLELIRAQINSLKSEMESARTRVLETDG